MADVKALFEELSKLTKDEAKTLKDMLAAKLPKSEPKPKKDDKKAEESAAQEG